MNYRHVFHAGNFADCVKHAILVWLLRAFAGKPSPFFVLDTHAGIGHYDLESEAATRTGEWRAGIGRLLADPPAPLADYVGLVGRLGLYPGSPAIARALLRPGDRLACCELHPEDAKALRRLFAGDAQVGVHRRDGYEALRGLLPPAERRGLVFIDPPFESADEYERLTAGLVTASQRFPAGVLVAWYPITHRILRRSFHARLRAARLGEAGLRDVVAAELRLRATTDPGRLNGCGVVVVNPPYRFEAEIATLLAALLERLGTRAAGEGSGIERLVDE